ncbi:pyridoxal phosphate-dependent decarboxylase family protein [Dyadobacter pollutisoli]|uniref:Aspartate aminotransferase family protein n=1 Tax=Dyadobacter pollutisoli TaxID=2910158 RepID=A0A9E8SNT9_9BACT|nr:aspartate aminotransferase family protein [Dyadobacter pollutisoli]WAC14041.1 aspartate aminotransferase family protein [Dyadobacter pollutisoli]
MKRSAPIHIDAEQFRKNGHMLIDRIAAFLESLPEQPVTKGEQPREIRALLGNEPLPVDATPLENIYMNVSELLFQHSLHNGHPRFWGYITSSAAPAGILADLLAASVNANVGAYPLSPVATEIEKQTVRWIAEFIGFPNDCGGLFVSGGNMANITGLLAARKAKAPWDIRKTGLNSRKMLIYCSVGTHTWIHKAADLLGFGTDSIRWIGMNGDQQMQTQLLENQIIEDLNQGHLPFVVVGTAGSVSTGSVDRLSEIAAVCKKHELWFHIDGAYGAPAVIVPEVTALFDGLELADSVALDPHKWLYSPLEAGCILVRNPKALAEAFSFRPEYYNFDGSDEDPATNFHEEGMQNSRGFRALKVWVTLRQVGKNGYIGMLREDIQLAKKLYDLTHAHPDMEAVSNHLSITTFRYVPRDFDKNDLGRLNKLNEELVNRIQTGGEAFVSNAVIDGKYCLRVCIVNYRTSEEDIEALVEIVERFGNEVFNQLKVK